MVGKVSKRRGVRNARIASRSSYLEPMLPELNNSLAPSQILSAEQLNRLNDASMDILENVGVIFRDEIALEDWRKAGSKVVDNRVYLDRHHLQNLMKNVPVVFTLCARDAAKSLTIGSKQTIFVPMSGANFIRDMSDERRTSSLDDLASLHKLSHVLPAIHSLSTSIVTPHDVTLQARHINATYSAIKHSDKALLGYANSGQNAADTLAMCDMVFGKNSVDSQAVIMATMTATAPLLWDAGATEAMRHYVQRGQPVICSPAVHAGGNTPASVLATVVQVNAHILAAIGYAQLLNPGVPVVYGQNLSSASMRTADAMMATPEVTQMAAIFGQLARHYGLPYQATGGVSGAKILDAQAGYETAASVYSALGAGANVIDNAVGSMEAGSVCSIAKFMVDAEYCAMGYRMASALSWDDFEDALNAIGDVGPGQRYFGHPHTMQHFESAFFMPKLHDYSGFQLWQAQGSQNIQQRAVRHAEQLLAEYQPPVLDVAVDEALQAFISSRENS
jgi:trimethylamine--corrinoid protein Co-methyltransferase